MNSKFKLQTRCIADFKTTIYPNLVIPFASLYLYICRSIYP